MKIIERNSAHKQNTSERLIALQAAERLFSTWDRTRSEVVNVVVTTILFLFPESQVLLKELDNWFSITEIILLKLVDLVKSILECAVGELASHLVVFHDFVVENGEVKGETELDGVAWGQGNLVCLIVSFERILLYLL